VHRVWLDERLRTQSWLERLSITLNPTHRMRLAAERRLFASPRLQAVICISEMVRAEILTHFSIVPEKLHVIYNAVDTENFSPVLNVHRGEIRARYGIPADAMLYLLVGSGYTRKGVTPAIDAIARLPENTHLLVVGKDKHAARYQTHAQALGAASRRIHFAGPQVDTHPFYGAADVFVLPTLYDPLSNAVLEALACGLPVLTSTKCGAGEIVQAHQAGFLCDARDTAALADNMVRLFDPDLRRQCATRARAAAMTLSTEAMTKRLLGLYQSLLSEARPL
jgi:UDP-glucose:(heptosyl)LPS alpha-1,3-glucosyltransferase